MVRVASAEVEHKALDILMDRMKESPQYALMGEVGPLVRVDIGYGNDALVFFGRLEMLGLDDLDIEPSVGVGLTLTDVQVPLHPDVRGYVEGLVAHLKNAPEEAGLVAE